MSKNMLVDTHAHLNFNAYKDDVKKVFKRAIDLDMGLVMPGSQFSTSSRAVELAEKWDSPRVWAAVGLHPIHLEERKVDKMEQGERTRLPAPEGTADGGQVEHETHSEEFMREKYEKLAKSEKVVAIGEIGLDYWYRPKTKQKGAAYAQKQIKALNAQLDMALDLKLPVILHSRVAHKDILRVLREHLHTDKFDIPGVVHSYTGSPKQFKKFAAMGYYIGINGLIFTLGLMEEVAAAVPMDRILLETDSPYLTPPEVGGQTIRSKAAERPDPGHTRNEPANIKYIAQKIAEIKGVSFEEVAKQTTENAQKVFGVNFKGA